MEVAEVRFPRGVYLEKSYTYCPIIFFS